MAGSGRRAVVVGGGIGGLAAALALHRAGWQVQVLERQPDFTEIGAGITLVINALRALRALGLEQAVRGAGQVETGIVWRTPTGRRLSQLDAGSVAAHLGTASIGIHRETLHRILRDALPGELLTSGATVDRIEPEPDRATVRYRTNAGAHTMPADLVVGADGIRSGIRHTIFPDLPPPQYVGSTAWRAVTEGSWVGRMETSLTWGPGAEFGIVPLGDGRVYWYGAEVAPPGGRAVDEAAEVRRRFGHWHAPISDLMSATEPAKVLRHDLFDLVQGPPAYVSGRVVLLGDAAHAMPPYLGQGAAQALEDAAVLGAYCAGPDLDDALARYDRDRRPRAQRVARVSRRTGRFGQQLVNPAGIAVRNALTSLLPTRLVVAQVARLADWQPPRTGVGG